ncbi:MAG: hypothetical protein ACK4IY_02245 [Chitinophagales bacterium]
MNVLAGMQLDAAAYAGRWQTDTTKFANGFTLSYHNTHTDLPMQTCVVQLENGAVTLLKITTTEKNLLYSTEKKYTYIPDSTFYISIQHKTLFYPERNFSIRYVVQ